MRKILSVDLWPPEAYLHIRILTHRYICIHIYTHTGTYKSHVEKRKKSKIKIEC